MSWLLLQLHCSCWCGAALLGVAWTRAPRGLAGWVTHSLGAAPVSAVLLGEQDMVGAGGHVGRQAEGQAGVGRANVSCVTVSCALALA
jgi:hypothetical protein